METLYIVGDEVEKAGPNFLSAREYIEGHWAGAGALTIVPMFSEGGYLSPSYYVHLLAAARGHEISQKLEWFLSSTPKLPPRPAPNKEPVLGIVHTPAEPFCASDSSSVQAFARVAETFGLRSVILSKNDRAALDGIDALFIRDLTTPAGYTYEFACAAAQRGIPVLDHPRSIVRCSNKLFIHEALKRAGVPTLRTSVICPEADAAEVASKADLPLVLKVPNGSFSLGMRKATSRADIIAGLQELRQLSSYVLAQEYAATPFDWRIGVLGSKPLYACKYEMAAGHWQVIEHRADGTSRQGAVVPISLDCVPGPVVRAAVAAAACIGPGLYGVDVKELQDGPRVLEVNDNPDIYDDAEANHNSVWAELADWFTGRLGFCERTGLEHATFGLAA